MTQKAGSPFILSSPFPEAFARHLREAVETLGYYEHSSFDELAAMYRERWEGGISATMLRREEFKHLLSEKGLADRLHAQKATFLRSYFNLRREEFDAAEPQWSTFCSRVQFAARAQWQCDRATAMNGTVRHRSERWQLPMPNCAQEWCSCRWDYLFDGL